MGGGLGYSLGRHDAHDVSMVVDTLSKSRPRSRHLLHAHRATRSGIHQSLLVYSLERRCLSVAKDHT